MLLGTMEDIVKNKDVKRCPKIARGHSQQSGAGVHGGTKTDQRRRERRNVRLNIRRGES